MNHSGWHKFKNYLENISYNTDHTLNINILIKTFTDHIENAATIAMKKTNPKIHHKIVP